MSSLSFQYTFTKHPIFFLNCLIIEYKKDKLMNQLEGCLMKPIVAQMSNQEYVIVLSGPGLNKDNVTLVLSERYDG